MDSSIEKTLGVVKILGKIGEGIIGFSPLTKSILISGRTKFHQIRFKIATTGAMTDTQTDRQTPVIL